MTDQRGFTLVELLVAMIAASLLLLGLANVNGALVGRVRTGASAEADLQSARGGAALARIVANATPATRPEQFVASDQAIRFPIRWAGAGHDGEPIYARLSVEQRSDGAALMVAILPSPTGDPINGSIEPLLTGARSIMLRPTIATSSAGDRRLDLLQIEFVDAAGTPQSWSAASRVNATPGCRFDPISLTCRPG